MIATSDLRPGRVVYVHCQARVYQAVAEAPRHFDDGWTFRARHGRRLRPDLRHVYASPLDALQARGDGMAIDCLTADERRAWGALPEPMPGADATRDEIAAFVAARGGQ